MELHLFDDKETPLFRILHGEPLWHAFHRWLHDASMLSDLDQELDQDVDLQPSHIRAALVTLEAVLRDGLARALAQGKRKIGPTPMLIGAVTANVLGTRLALNLRMDEDLWFSRTNDAVVALRKASEAGRSVHVLVIPEWPRIARTLAWLLRQEPEPVTTDDLRNRLVLKLEESRQRTSDAGMAQDHANDVDVVRRLGLNDTLSFLMKWRMAAESSPGVVHATDKLRMMRL